MNRYTVVYLTEAEDNLIAMWADATDRDLITESANVADRVFANSPLEESIELPEQLRRLESRRCDSTSKFVRMIESS